MAQQAVPVFKKIRLEQGNRIENVIVPFTDGKKALQVLDTYAESTRHKW